MKRIKTYNEFSINEELTRGQRTALWLPWALISKAGQKLFNIYPMLNLRWNDLKQKTKDSKFDTLFSSTGSNDKLDENITKINDLPKATTLKLGMLFRNWNIYLSDRKSKGGSYGPNVPERPIIYLSKDEIKKDDYCNFERLNDRDIYTEYKSGKPENEEDYPMIILAAKYSEKENLDDLEETIKDVWLEFTDEYPDFEIEPSFNLQGDYLRVYIKFNNRVIRFNPGHNSKVKDEEFIKLIEELSETTENLLENEFGSFNHKMTFKIEGQLTYTGNAGRFGTEIIPEAKELGDSDIYDSLYKMLAVNKLGLYDHRFSIGIDDIQTLLDDIDNCYTTDFYLIELRPEENKATGILVSGISVVFRKRIK